MVLKPVMSNSSLGKLIWLLIYIGLLVCGLGVWYVEHSLAVGATLLSFGGGSVAVGVALIWVRSRRP
jgi:hypothetical protein